MEAVACSRPIRTSLAGAVRLPPRGLSRRTRAAPTARKPRGHGEAVAMAPTVLEALPGRGCRPMPYGLG